MKIAVTAQGNDRQSPVDPHFARARYFFVADLANNVFTVRNNVALQQTPHLAGTQAAGTLISLGVQAVITGHIGPKAFTTLTSAGVRVFQTQARTVAEAIDSFQAGTLVEFSTANVGEHWPQVNKI